MIGKVNCDSVAHLADQLTGASSSVEGRSLWQDARRRFTHNQAAMVSLFLLVLVVMLCVLGSELGNFAYDEVDWSAMQIPPDLSNGHFFGTDSLGRDLFTRTLLGGQISLAVGILGAMTAIVIGTAYGAFAGFIGGRVDRLMMRLLEILNSIPFMFVVILLVTFFGRNMLFIFVAIGAVSWLDMARIVRGQTINIKNKEFIEAARVCGVGSGAIIARHILPNVLGIVVVYATLLVPNMILYESFLSYIGLGVQEPMASWGTLLNEGSKTMDVAPWQLLFPAGFLVSTLFCFNFIGDGLRDALDPKEH